MGHELTVRAFPHQSQDAEVHVCAHTAIWSLFRYLSQRYPQYPERYPYDIALLNKDLGGGRPLPSKGLRMDQVTAMLGQFGLGAEMYLEEYMSGMPLSSKTADGWATVRCLSTTPKSGSRGRVSDDDTDKLLHLAQVHIDSGLSPLIGLPGHLVVAPGVSYANEPVVSRPGKMLRASDFMSGVVVNDDNHPPYRVLPRTRSKTLSTYDFVCADADALVTSLPEKVFLTAERAEAITTELLNSQGAPLKSSSARYIRRLFCTSSKNLKQARISGRDPFTERIIQQPLPHFLWITEIALASQWLKSGSVLVEVAIDATAGPYDVVPFLWVRYPTRLFINHDRLHGWRGRQMPKTFTSKTDLRLNPFQGNLSSYT